MSCVNGVPITAHHGRSRKPELRPAGAAQRAGLRDMPAAAGADRRKQDAPAVQPSARAGKALDLFVADRPRGMPIAPSIARKLHSARRRCNTGTGPCSRSSIATLCSRASAAPWPPPSGGADFLMRPRGRRPCRPAGDRRAAFRQGRGAVLPDAGGSATPSWQAARRGSSLRVEADAGLPGGGRGPGRQPPDHVPLEPESLDLAVSLLSLHEANDIPGMLIQIRRALRPDGLFLGAMAGGGTLAELRESLLAAETELFGGASPRVIPFTDVRDAGALLQRAGFALPVADVETVTVRYDTMFGLMQDLRAMGATNALADRAGGPVTRRLFARAAEIYAERFSDPDGRVRATFSIVWMSGWAPDASQQKPLKPGSATVSLTDILNPLAAIVAVADAHARCRGSRRPSGARTAARSGGSYIRRGSRCCQCCRCLISSRPAGLPLCAR